MNQDHELPARTRPRLVIAYVLLLAATIGGFLLIRARGEQLTAPSAVGPTRFVGAAAESPSDPLMHLLLALAAVILVGSLLAKLFAYVGQPPVIGEVMAGILLGPSLLGRLWPEGAAFLMPPSIAPSLTIVAQLGVILYMFVVGLELDASVIRRHLHATIAISHASILVPFLLGAVLALGIYPILSTSDVPFTPFALFLGVSMSVTAFPVLARILTDRGLSKTNLGVIALACAATDDVTAWCLLAFVVGVAQARLQSALLVAVLTVGYLALVFLIIRPLMRRLEPYYDQQVTPAVMAIVLGGVLLSALATELIGVHAIFGAFLIGAVIPHDSTISRELTHKLGDLVTVLFLPAFFALTGMRTQIGLVNGLDHWIICLVIILVATVGKFGGTVAAARFTGMGWRDSACLGTLMNTRGLMELIVLNIGLDLGVISPTLFAMLVIMALVTTIATAPILQLLVPR